jgi:hypothetical protein
MAALLSPFIPATHDASPFAAHLGQAVFQRFALKINRI